MTVDGMVISINISIAFLIVPLMIVVFEWTIACNGAMKNFGMVMMRYQVVSQEY